MLTVNNSLARELRYQHGKEKSSLNEKVWTSPDIIPWSAWLKRCFQNLVDEGKSNYLLISRHQEKLLWENIISNDKRDSFFPSSITANNAMETWQLVNDWKINLSLYEEYFSEETYTYFKWQKKFLSICEKENYLTLAQLPKFLENMVENNALNYGQHLKLYGFEKINHAQKDLFEKMQKTCINIEYFSNNTKKSKKLKFSFDDSESEIRAAASWAKNYLKKSKNHHIAIVSPQLKKRRKNIERIFSEVNDPSNILPGKKREPSFQFSTGMSLSSKPCISQLLLCLKLAIKDFIPFSELTILLRSSFISGAKDEWPKRAKLDRIFLENGLPQFSLDQFIEKMTQVPKSSSGYCPIFIKNMKNFRNYIENLPKKASPAIWSNHLFELIKTLGWPGDSPYTDEEYQIIKKLKETFSTFSTLGQIKEEISFSEAVIKLTALCNDTYLQNKNLNNIHVLEMNEAISLDFNAIWLLDMNDHYWPKQASPNPIIPYHIQRKLKIPGSSSEIEYESSKKMSNKILSTASLIIVSYSNNDDGQQRRPSSFFKKIPLTEKIPFPLCDLLYAAGSKRGEVDELPAPESVPPISSPPGGSRLMENQAACPFSAVAIHRLRAAPLPNLGSGTNPMMMGTILHELMKIIWGTIENNEKLEKLDLRAIGGLIESSFQTVMKEFILHRPDIYTETFLNLEKNRLTKLITEWLYLEKKRQKKFYVLSIEKNEEINLGKLFLKIRSDRVDFVENEGEVIIDYKSSKNANIGDWFDDRPSELQIPLYCVENSDNPSAAVIARIHSENMKFIGLSKNHLLIPGVEKFQGNKKISDWDSLLAFWKKTLLSLANEIMAGRADIDPKNENDCNVCELQSLCRFRKNLRPIFYNEEVENDK